MKTLFFTILLFVTLHVVCLGQKPVIQDTTYKSWTSVDMGAISDDGNYVSYRINNEPRGEFTYVVKATSGKWEKRLMNIKNLKFSADCKLLFAMQKDTLIQITLGTSKINKTAGYASYRLFDAQDSQWLITESTDRDKVFVIQNLKTGKIQVHKNMQQLITNGNSDQVIFIEYGQSNTVNLLRGKLSTGLYEKVYTGQAPANFIFDGTGSKFAFTDSPDQITHIFYSDGQSDQVQEILNDHSKGLLPHHKITFGKSWTFSKDGNNLFFSQLKIRTEVKKAEGEPDIWRYDDTYLLSRYKELGGLNIYKGENLSTINLQTRAIKQLLSGTQRIISGIGEKTSLVMSADGDMAEGDYENTKPSYFLSFYETGKILPIKINCKEPIKFQLSPNQQYLVYYDSDKQSFCTYDIKTGQTRLFHSSAKAIFRTDVPFKNVKFPATFAGWIENTNRLILQGNYDLWEIDVEKNTPARNLTNWLGEKEQIAFSIAKGYPDKANPVDEDLFLLGFNLKTKESGIYSLKINNGKLKCLLKGDVYLGRPYQSTGYFDKAKYADKYLWKLSSVDNSPNYFFSSGSGKPIPISRVYPERNYNWIKSEIVSYPDQSGFGCQSIIYKPENFASTKKYPVIFFYYRLMSDDKNQYQFPEPSNMGLNIPLLVSNGYIVVKSDIHLDMGKPGEGPLESIMAAADHMSKYNWIDSTKMGIFGHSLGGFETNYIITHINRFAAASVGAGMSNMIEYYNNIWEEGNSHHGYTKAIGFQVGLDISTERYVNNSPIFDVKKIKTPLLLIHNQGDLNVVASHSIQMFVQMKSLKKPVWLLQYDNEGHTIENEANQLNSQQKFKDFFDFFLKKESKPLWMLPQN